MFGTRYFSQEMSVNFLDMQVHLHDILVRQTCNPNFVLIFHFLSYFLSPPPTIVGIVFEDRPEILQKSMHTTPYTQVIQQQMWVNLLTIVVL